MNQYFSNSIKLTNKGIYLDLFTQYFENHLKNRVINIKAGNAQEITKIRILMRYDPITNIKHFRIDNC